jgi:hypothetical protein
VVRKCEFKEEEKKEKRRRQHDNDKQTNKQTTTTTKSKLRKQRQTTTRETLPVHTFLQELLCELACGGGVTQHDWRDGVVGVAGDLETGLRHLTPRRSVRIIKNRTQ